MGVIPYSRSDICAPGMSTRSTESSSQTWSGDERVPANVIDLDKFIHNAVRVSTTRRREPAESRRGLNGLVVDAGGVERKVPAVGSKLCGAAGAACAGGAAASAGVTCRPHCSSVSSGSTPPHAKHFSHDSGLSDGSVRHRKQRMLRRGGSEVSRRTGPVRSGVSASSLRAFRALCERALCDQQTLIVRVAELCERLSERPAPGAGALPARADHSYSPRSSEDSTSTHTSASKYNGLRDKQRTDEFNTYKLIMTKLDDMSRLLAVRGQRSKSRGRLHCAASSGSVTVSDKIVATEPAPLQAARNRRGTNKTPKFPTQHTRVNTNVTVHKAILGERERGAYAHPTRYNHDDAHVTHIYSKSARVHALPAIKRRALSMGAHLDTCADDERAGYKREVSLCALCRFYWRTFRQYLSTQICSPVSRH